jgi:hypothetical protein
MVAEQTSDATVMMPDIAQLLAHAKQSVLTFLSGGFRKLFILYTRSYCSLPAKHCACCRRWRSEFPPAAAAKEKEKSSSSSKADAPGVERLCAYARVALTDNRCSMLMQLLQEKMDGMLHEGEVLSRCAKPVSAMLADEASFESILNDLQQFEKEDQVREQERAHTALVICLAMQKDEGRTQATRPIIDLFVI